MISLAPGTKVFLACRPVDLRNGFDGLASKVQQMIGADPFGGQLFIFRGKRGDYFKGLYWDGSGMWLIAKRLETGRFVWPPIVDGAMTLTPAQFSVLIEAMDWRRTIASGSDLRGDDREAICRALTEGGVLTTDLDLLRQAARRTLVGVLSCRENRSQSGPFARIAGEAIGASLRLPNMATEEFLSCLSRGALENVARAEAVNIAPRAKDTRARMVTRFKAGTFVYPGALFRLTVDEQEAAARRRRQGAGWVRPETADDDESGGDHGTEPEAGDEAADGFDQDDPAEREAA